ncbi:DUF2971 domain-containing protein [Bacteroides sp. AN502(2024)]|uniref:DUF2971 domain-containing protein n=1 Tax=Bacteroides sp. AN502(2024) TaxID=3160599 RepID=UPI003513ABC3
MNRDNFAKVLKETIISGDVEADKLPKLVYPIRQAIEEIMPSKLFRYRAVNDNNIEALKSDSVYTVTADNFNDPYDSLFQYNLDEISSIIMSTANVDFMSAMQTVLQRDAVQKELTKFFPTGEFVKVKENLLNIDLSSNTDSMETQLKSMATFIILFIKEIAPEVNTQIRNSVSYACFSENVDSITMWSHYANNHTGFALGYTKEALSFNKMNTIHCGLFPVIYDSIRYNGSSLFAWAIYNIFGIHMIEIDKLANIKVGLYKSTDWSYEKEWRLIHTLPTSQCGKSSISPVEMIPSEIYYGARIKAEDKTKLHKIAVRKGLIEYEMYVDNASSQYTMQFKRLK